MEGGVKKKTQHIEDLSLIDTSWCGQFMQCGLPEHGCSSVKWPHAYS